MNIKATRAIDLIALLSWLGSCALEDDGRQPILEGRQSQALSKAPASSKAASNALGANGILVECGTYSYYPPGNCTGWSWPQLWEACVAYDEEYHACNTRQCDSVYPGCDFLAEVGGAYCIDNYIKCDCMCHSQN